MNCPSCGAEVPPGTYVCVSCGFDFVRGKKPEESLAVAMVTQRWPQLLAAGAGALVLILAASFGYHAWVQYNARVPEPCEESLALLAKKIDRKVLQGARDLSDCELTPPGSVSCWKKAGVPIKDFPTTPGERYELRFDDKGNWRVLCHVDVDADGKPETFAATASEARVQVPSGT
jgi:hypothetical protein